jgi:molybdenum cofactor synthesis domain-containing protein
MPSAKVLTVSDSVAGGRRVDTAGPALVAQLEASGFRVDEHRTVADDQAEIAAILSSMAEGFAGLIVSTGGTGFGPRDCTPEATASVIERAAPGFGELMRRSSPKGALSRGISGTRGRSLVVNLPGSPTGAHESLDAIIALLPHALELLAGEIPH